MNFIKQKPWTKITAICLVFIISVYALLLIESQNKGPDDSLRRTTYSNSIGGYKALYLWLNQLGLPVKRFEQSLKNLSNEATVLMIAEPEFGLGTGERDALTAWINDGGTLISTGSRLKTLWDQFGIEDEFIDKFSQTKNHENKKIFIQPGPYTEGVGSVDVKSLYSIKSSRPETLFPVSDEAGGVIAVIREGKGWVIAISDPGILSNVYLKNKDHSRLVLNMFLTHMGRGYIYVDEYHHGYGRATSVFKHFSQSKLFVPMIQLFIIILLLWAAFGRRFGESRSKKRLEHHSSMEYIKAIAQLHQKARTRSYALDSASGWIKEEAKRLLIDTNETFKASLNKVFLSSKDGTMTDRELVQLMQQLYDDFNNARNKGPA